MPLKPGDTSQFRCDVCHNMVKAEIVALVKQPEPTTPLSYITQGLNVDSAIVYRFQPHTMGLFNRTRCPGSNTKHTFSISLNYDPFMKKPSHANLSNH